MLELHLRGFSESQIADKLGVVQQTVSRDLSLVRQRETQLRKVNAIHTFEKSYAMWCRLLKYFWRLSEETKEIAERRKIGEVICEVLRNIDERFLPTSTLPTSTDGSDHSDQYRAEVYAEARGNANGKQDI